MPTLSWAAVPGLAKKYSMMVWASLRRQGVVAGVGQLVAEWTFDRRHGLSAWMPREVGPWIQEPGFRVADAVQYQGVDPRLAGEILAMLPADLRQEATFIDYGCGKARGLAVGILAGFRRLVGVEVSRELAAVGQRNLRALRARHPGVEVEVLIQDASRFGMPDGPLVAFLYNPFLGRTLDRVVHRLQRHALRWPVWVVYINPVGLPVFLRRGFKPYAARGANRAVLLRSMPT